MTTGHDLGKVLPVACILSKTRDNDNDVKENGLKYMGTENIRMIRRKRAKMRKKIRLRIRIGIKKGK